jgi:hypothetical protein
LATASLWCAAPAANFSTFSGGVRRMVNLLAISEACCANLSRRTAAFPALKSGRLPQRCFEACSVFTARCRLNSTILKFFQLLWL